MILDDRLTQQIKNIQSELTNKGQLYSKPQLDQFYATFRQKFGPERLQALDGEALLELMHSHGNHDSLVYWLEFKNDEEFPNIFGSILGGSAHKFGLYRRKETNTWVTGSPAKPLDVTAEEAIQITRRHRDELLRGIDLLSQLHLDADDDEYAKLQRAMEQDAHEVSDWAWGHKYFSLLFPDKLDNYHSKAYQNYHLIRLLQLPPGTGFYSVAGRFMAIARELEMPVQHLTAILNHRNKEPYRYWRVGTHSGVTGESFWPYMRENNYVSIGWAELGDLSWVANNMESKNRIRELLVQKAPDTDPGVITKWSQQIFYFVATIQSRDIILAADGATILGIGKVTGPYTYDSSFGFSHLRPVEWLDLQEWKMPKTEGLQTTVYEFRKDAGNLVEIERRILGAPPLPPLVFKTLPKPQVRVSEPAPLPAPPKLDGIPGRIQAVLERKGQAILYGPPGTGKTHWARLAVNDLAAYHAYGKAYKDLTEAERNTVTGQGGLVRLCSFHPAYGYEDFLEGYRPLTARDQLSFERRDGLFKKLCDDARKLPSRRFYLIIDEINRGDIPRIFGELLTVLEKDKRGQPISLPLSPEPFSVPGNVYLIGTMNTADRSIALLDTALRRRFGFIELMPDPDALESAAVAGIPLGPWLESLNNRITKYVGRDARNLQIGHAYLFDGGKPVADAGRFIRILQDDIVPLLEEYCYEDYKALASILGSTLVDETNQLIRHELFDEAQLNELAQALLQPDPDITTSARAAASDVVEADDTGDQVESDDESAA